ncbi:MAG: hypothetical protein ABEL51_02575, partial [Salinibacter sp.]
MISLARTLSYDEFENEFKKFTRRHGRMPNTAFIQIRRVFENYTYKLRRHPRAKEMERDGWLFEESIRSRLFDASHWRARGLHPIPGDHEVYNCRMHGQSLLRDGRWHEALDPLERAFQCAVHDGDDKECALVLNIHSTALFNL